MSEHAPVDVLERLERLLDEGLTREAAALLAGLPPSDAAAAITDLPPRLRPSVLLLVDPERAAEIVEELPDDVRAGAIKGMDPSAAAAILGEMYTDEEADVLQELPPDAAEAIIQRLEREDARDVRELMVYGEETAGGLMQKEFISVPVDYTASETVVMLRSRAEEFADFAAGYIYAVDRDGRLRGVVTTRALLLCEASAPIERIMETAVSVPADMPAEELVKVFRRTNYLAIPVVDAIGRLIGVVLHDDMLEYELEESEEEMMQMSGILGGEEVREMPLTYRARNRLLWLTSKIILNLIPASVVAMHEETIKWLPVLAVIMPVVSDLGGGAGSQAIAVSIRELTLERVRPRDFMQVLWKEASVGVVNGLALALGFGLVIGLWQRNAAMGALAATAIGVNTLVAVVVGGLLPLILRKLRIDPAVASMPLLTTMTDFSGFWLVLGLASYFYITGG